MKLPFRLFVLALGFAAQVACSSARQEVLLRNFEWSVAGDTAPFSFDLENATADKIDVDVLIVAESRRESKVGTRLSELGHEKINLVLGPKEKKKVAGLVHLVSSGDIALQTFITVKRNSFRFEVREGEGADGGRQTS